MTETAPAAAVSAETVEIRVHGVSGTPVESLLEISAVRQVDGDNLAGFYRLPETRPESDVRCEAFRWGDMTSGSVSKAVWLLMAPLGVINLAGFTLPAPAGKKAQERALGVAEALLRLLALGMTLLLVTAVTFVAVDQAAWQCGGDKNCAKKLLFLTAPQYGWHFRLACAALVPAAMVLILDRISRKVYLYPPVLPEGHKSGSRPGRDLGDRDFWAPKPRTALLRRLHLTASLAVVTMLITHLSTHYVSGLQAARGWPRPVLWALFWIACAIAVLCLVATAAGRTPGLDKVDAVTDPNAVPGFYRAVYGVAWAAFAAAALVGGGHAGGGRGQLPVWLTGFDWAFQAYYAYAALLLVLLAVANAVLARGSAGGSGGSGVPKPYRRLWAGMTCTVLTGFAVLLATGFTSGLILQTARLFGHRDQLTKTQQTLDLPDLFHVTTLLWGLLIVPLVAVAAVCLFWRAIHPRWPQGVTFPGRIVQEYPENAQPEERTVTLIRKSWQRARLKYRLPTWLCAIGVAGWVAAVAQGVLGALAVPPGRDPVPRWLQDHVYTGRNPRIFFTFVDEALGTWTLTALAAGLAFLGMRAFRNPTWRRTVGIIWDLLAFWPRWIHPIVPPPYGGRAVLGLVKRVEDKAAAGDKVVLSGHSQGSLICAAAVLATPDKARQRLALLTYGSQLMWAYSRLFPAHVGYDTLKDLYAVKLKDRWYNLHRWTDPIGGPVLAYPGSAKVDPVLPVTDWNTIDVQPVEADTNPPPETGPWWRKLGPEYQLRDPRTVVPSDNAPATPMLGHSAYYADPAFDAVVRQLAAKI
ncbi:hypothetical protein ABZ848_16435 [Streptomyces sp. NPDC047081]|uniref:hypothetical protein n=1 Tax=Streptomyces sp. NPDC047081 TaxID=3154706 RepID=UPI0033EBF5E1